RGGRGAGVGQALPSRRAPRQSEAGGRAVKKIVAVSFLNARPITHGLEHGVGDDRFELSFELPSRCAELLERGEVDLGLVPTASYAAASGELRIVRSEE